MAILSTRETFDRRLRELLSQVLALGSMVEQAVLLSVDALIRHDRSSSKRVIDEDQKINEKRCWIENECVRLIATQQPVGRDVRFLAAILEIITELERIGDYAKGIGKINLLLDKELDDMGIFKDLTSMADRGLSMLNLALVAFVNSDVNAALAIPADDDNVDHLYNQIYLKLTQRMIADTTTVEHASHLLWAAHNLERLADRVINICERIVYVSTGEIRELDYIMTGQTNMSDKKKFEKVPKVLFLCTHNSARSQMAEAFLRKYAGSRFEVCSAGLEPGSIHPFTQLVMEELGLDLKGHRSKGLTEFLGKDHFSYLITVCDRAEQKCPIFPGMGTRLHWSFEDPTEAPGTEQEKLEKFRQVRDQIKTRITEWTSVPQT